MRMETETKIDKNHLAPYNEKHGPTTTDLSKPDHVLKQQKIDCGIPNGKADPNESENKLKDDLSDIHNKASKKEITRSQRIGPADQPGSSQGDKQRSGASCGIYYGIKSYLHQFYGPPDKEVLKSGEYVQGDDFRFVAEPQHKGCWIRVGMWVGINLILLGGIAMMVGYFTPPRQAVVGEFEEFTVLDRWAVDFNYHLMICQLVGLITFSFGAVVVVCSLLVASCRPPLPPPAYLVMGAYLPTPTPYTGKHPDNPPSWGIHCIPLSGTVKGVQPQFLQSQY